METSGREKKKQGTTPIIDGDARPDINIDPETRPRPEIERAKDKGRTTKNRADKNNLEDFRDAR